MVDEDDNQGDYEEVERGNHATATYTYEYISIYIHL
jgi:hypothetical protein